MTEFSALPEECVQLVFDRVPIADLLLIRRVSRTWQRHQQLNCTRRKTLIVLHGYSPEKVITLSLFNEDFAAHNIDQNGNSQKLESYIEQHHILAAEGKSLKVKSIVKTFPNIRTLIIASDYALSPNLRSFNQLIAKYSSKLVTLQMYFRNEIQTRAQQKSVSLLVGSLFNQLNSMTALEHFTFDTFGTAGPGNSVGWSKLIPPIDRPVFLTRIKELNIRCRGVAIIMHHCLLRYANEDGLGPPSRVNLGAMFKAVEEEDILVANWPVEVAKCLSYAPYDPDAYNRNKNNLETVIATFPSLARIEFFLSILGEEKPWTPDRTPVDVTLSNLANLLSPLTKLIHLQLHLYDVDIQSELLDPASTAQLESIKALELKFELTSADCSMFRNELDTFVHIFPNLRSIRVLSLDNGQEDTDVLTQSARDLLADLKGVYGRDSLEVTVVIDYEFEIKL